MNKELWLLFWEQLQEDIADVLQHNILNFSTLIGAIMLYTKICKPQYYEIVADFANSYLIAMRGNSKQ